MGLRRAIILLCIVASGIGFLLTRPPAPWRDLDTCELADFAFARYGRSLGTATLQEFLETGVTIEEARSPNRLIVTTIENHISRGRDATQHHIEYNRLTGRLTEMRLGIPMSEVQNQSALINQCLT
jgi:hypothetical protein